MDNYLPCIMSYCNKTMRKYWEANIDVRLIPCVLAFIVLQFLFRCSCLNNPASTWFIKWVFDLTFSSKFRKEFDTNEESLL